MSLPLVAIVGRPNVGKSTLFNRLVGRPLAIVEDIPGTTRDRIYADVSWQEREFTIVDTGGLEVHPSTSLLQQVKQQVEMALAEADVILFLVDAKGGLTPSDEEIAERLRVQKKPVMLVVNKADSPRQQMMAPEFYRLGLGDPNPISAYHGRGTGDLLDGLLLLLPPAGKEEEDPGMKVAIVGRPNVGKSLLLNRILGQERAVVSEIPGTTRDALDTPFQFEGQPILLIDTAGIRKRARVEAGIEHYGVLRALRAIARSDVVLLLIEAPQGVMAQDLHIVSYVHESCKGLVILINKWDLIENPDPLAYQEMVRERLVFMPYAPLLFISALRGWGIEQVLPIARRVYQDRLRQLPPAQVTKVVNEAVSFRSPPLRGRGGFRLFSVAQTGVNPPTFLLEVSRPTLPATYLRYLESRLRQAFGYITPLKLILKARSRKERAARLHGKPGEGT